MWFLSSFSIQMLPDCRGTVRFTPIEEAEARRLLRGGFRSAIGHETTARVLSQRLGMEVPFARVEVTLRPGEGALVAQLRLPRGPEGGAPSVEQVAAAPIVWVRVDVLE